MIRVVCWKWKNPGLLKKGHGFSFSSEHVNRLYSMVKRHLHIPFEFCCITDDPRGIVDGIRTIPLWQDHRNLGGCYVRLKAFSEEMKEIIGPRFVWMDLDTVILGDITPLFDRTEDMVIWGDTARNTPYNGSMVLMNAGSRKQVWETFSPDKKELGRKLGYVGTDQAYIAACLGPHEKRWSTHDGVYSFRCHIKATGKTIPPPGARIIFFHGSADPSHGIIQDRYPWVKTNWR